MMPNGQPPKVNLAQKMIRCSNEECEFHLQDCVFSQETLACVMFNVLDPGQIAPVPVALRFVCIGCGWMLKPGGGEGGKHITVDREKAAPGEEWKKG